MVSNELGGDESVASIALARLYVAPDESRYVTGTVLPIDSSYLAGRSS